MIVFFLFCCLLTVAFFLLVFVELFVHTVFVVFYKFRLS